jgi:hypothetical protein
MTELNEFSYFNEVEETFTRLREKSFMIGPLDWTLIESWKERGIPLPVVLRSIEEVFKNHKSGTRRRAINSLRYCQSEVEAQYDEWLKSRVGAHVSTGGDSDRRVDSSPFAKEAVNQHIDTRRDDLINRALQARTESQVDFARTLEDADWKLVGLQAQFSVEEDVRVLEDELTKIDRDLDLAVHHAATPDQVTEAREKVEEAMKPYARQMPPDSYQKTFGDLLTKRLREMFGVPRLSLFHMK